jgi:hypothetical protein
VLAYGAWRAQRHADVWLGVHDHAGRTTQRLWVDVNDARLSLRDGAGTVLAEAVLAPPHGLPRWTGPPGAIDCGDAARGAAWQRCFDAQSRWMALWAPRADHAAVSVGACRIERVAVVRRSYGDWWLWWVPLPHVGGTPMSHHTLQIHLDSVRCTALTGP